LNIRRPLLLLSITVALCAHLAIGHTAPLEVVTTTAELRSLVQAVGGEMVHAVAMVADGRDAESYVARPQDLTLLRRAQVVVRVGLDYDLWLNPLLLKSGNPKLRTKGPRIVDASQGVMLLDVRPGGLTDTGHSHGAGNPHFWLDPQNAELISAGILLALAEEMPAEAKNFENRRSTLLERLGRRQAQWEQRLRPLAGQPLIAYHNSWPYLARRFRLDFVGTIEPRVGVPPSPSHLAALLKIVRERKVVAVVVEVREPRKDAEFLARKAGIPLVILAASVDTTPEIRDYEDLFDFNVAALERILQPSTGAR
jgi:ABC-type Zn uptake system ZnuABC Zn-binding protein ZnuA